MKSLHAEVLIRMADEMLAKVEGEMNRAEKDVVTHHVCFNSRQSIIHYMRGFLLMNSIQPEEPATLVGLLGQCKNLSPKFSDIDLSSIHCRCEAHNKDYCLDYPQVDQCWQVARHTRMIISQERAEC